MEYSPQTDKKSANRLYPEDPRLGLFVFILLIASAFIIRSTEGIVCLFVYVFLLFSLSGASAGFIWNRSKKIILFALFAVLLNAVLVEGDPVLRIGERQIVSKEGLQRGIYYFFQILVLYLSIVLFVSLTSQEAIAKGISSLIKPFAPELAKRIALYAFLSIGFLPLFFDEFERISTLQKFRGGGLEGGLFKKIRGVRLLLVPLVLSAIHRSSQLAMVVELRGLKESAGKLLSFGRPAQRDYVFFVITLAVTAAAFVFPRLMR